MNAALVKAELAVLIERAQELMNKLDQEPEVQSPWMRTSEYAKHARVCSETVRAWCRQGMPSVGKGKLLRIHREQADAWRAER
jgi:hypothetical protein